jgi:hypothetical protein
VNGKNQDGVTVVGAHASRTAPRAVAAGWSRDSCKQSPHNTNQEVETIVLTIRRLVTSHGYFFTVLFSTQGQLIMSSNKLRFKPTILSLIKPEENTYCVCCYLLHKRLLGLIASIYGLLRLGRCEIYHAI